MIEWVLDQDQTGLVSRYDFIRYLMHTKLEDRPAGLRHLDVFDRELIESTWTELAQGNTQINVEQWQDWCKYINVFALQTKPRGNRESFNHSL